jgi:hypothetical protein
VNPANVCSSGSLVQASSRNGLEIFVGADLPPGCGRHAEVTIANLGSLPAAFRLLEVGASNEFPAGCLAFAIKELHDDSVARCIFIGEIGQLPGGGIDLGRFEPGESRTYRFIVALAKDKAESEVGGTASAAYEWSTAPAG